MLLTILLVVIALYTGFHLLLGGGNPFHGARGGLKGLWHFIVGLSLWVIFLLIIKVVWYLLLILSIDIVTPPYGFDIETLFAIPLAKVLASLLSLSFATALVMAYVLVFAVAISIIIIHFKVLRG